jgi:hypothetical protein
MDVRSVFGRFPAVAAVIAATAAALLTAGCTAPRPISDSGYRAEQGYGRPGPQNPFYKGELSEFELLGINPEMKITQDDLDKAFESKQRITHSLGSHLHS